MQSAGIQVIARAAAILRACAAAKGGLSLGEIAEAVSLPRSTVQRIVNALATEGLLHADGTHRSIGLGASLHELTSHRYVDVVETVHPYLKELSEQTGETVDLAMLRGDHLVFVDQVMGSQRLRAVSSVGESFSLHNTANGKAALALLPGETLTRILKTHGRFQTQALRRLLGEVEACRQSGFAEDNEEHTDGICALGTAFRVQNGVYAISIPMPTARFIAGKAKLRKLLLAAKHRIEEACRRSG